MRLYGELAADGRTVSYHPDVEKADTPLAQRMKIREVCQMLVARSFCRELVKTAVAARSSGPRRCSASRV